MLKSCLIGTLLITLTVLIQAIGTTLWLSSAKRRLAKNIENKTDRYGFKLLIGTAVVLFVLHALQIVLWAWTYLLLIPRGELQSLEQAVYFSFVTFTTLGYGDITLSEGWRLLSGIQALNGILLVGWSTALLFSVMQRLWQSDAADTVAS
jgi:hypothetical protein